MRGPNLSGQKFGRLLVQQRAERPLEYKDTSAWWECLCDCGKTVRVRARALKCGDTQSCGCFRLARLREAMIGPKPERWLPKGEAGFRLVLQSYKNNARKRDIAWDIADEHFRVLTKGYCFYCGAPPMQVSCRYKKDIDPELQANVKYRYNGVDRVQNELGYKVDNCVSCCGACNVAKGTMSQEEFLNWVRCVYVQTIRRSL